MFWNISSSFLRISANQISRSPSFIHTAVGKYSEFDCETTNLSIRHFDCKLMGIDVGLMDCILQMQAIPLDTLSKHCAAFQCQSSRHTFFEFAFQIRSVCFKISK